MYRCLIHYVDPRDEVRDLQNVADTLVDEIRQGVLIPAWNEIKDWLKSPPTVQISDAEMIDVIKRSEPIGDTILSGAIDPSLSVLYHVDSLNVFESFLWSSLRYDSLSLVILPCTCSQAQIHDVLQFVDHHSPRDYAAMPTITEWFATFNAETRYSSVMSRRLAGIKNMGT